MSSREQKIRNPDKKPIEPKQTIKMLLLALATISTVVKIL